MFLTQGTRRGLYLSLNLVGFGLLCHIARAAEPLTPLPRYVPSPAELAGADGRAHSPRNSARAYKLQLHPHWNEAGTAFWYVNEGPQGKREYAHVDAESGTRRPAFDHIRLRDALQQAGVASADQLLLSDLRFADDGKSFEFRSGREAWQCSLLDYVLTKLDRPAEKAKLRRDVPRASRGQGPETHVTFSNKTDGEVELFWLNSDGQRRSYGKIAAGADHEQHTFTGHVWAIMNAEGQPLGRYEAEESGGYVEITARSTETEDRVDPLQAPAPVRRGPGVSPDGQSTVFVRDHNLFLKPESGEEIVLTTDGSSSNSYEPRLLTWSPDSSHLVSWRVEPGDEQQVHFVESSPAEGGRAKLHSHGYPLPGDKFAACELNLFHVATHQQTKPSVERVDFDQPEIRWSSDGRHFTYEKVDRGHQRFRLIRVDSHTGESQTLVDEPTETFIWTAHPEGRGVALVTWLDGSNEFLYATERSGWRHLELHDATTGALKNVVTSGEYVVRGIDHIDEPNRQVWFRASGKIPGQDPYFIHHYRVNFDGTGLIALTDGNGNHSVQFSPNRKYMVDTYSRIDAAPVHELRRGSDGGKLCALETADIGELLNTGWTPPEVFTAKGRDGVTDIWGIIYRPTKFDLALKYPVLEDIYAGPHDSFVPKNFSPGRRNPLTDLGFWVVQIDGMGTANRSKAFHDVCWHNLKDAGLPDRILWHRALAAKYPQYDVDRVGIYGTSAGGQESTAALLFHPEFYKAAVSSCGCHDNRMDKASWNEQWMGYPVGPHYGESSNIDNAHRLKGHLLLLVGEMDTNVPPESTLRLVDALIKANKEFDFLVIPGLGHSNGGPFGQRKMKDFFVRHLHGVEPIRVNE